jgi:hypothetical protein
MRESVCVPAGAGHRRCEYGKCPGYPGIAPSRIAAEHRSVVRP